MDTMKKIILAVFILLNLFSTNCTKLLSPVDETGDSTIELNFKALYNETPLVTNKIYDYKGKKVRFSRFSFYMSPINFESALDKNKNQTTTVLKADFTDLDSDAKATEGVKMNINSPQTTFSKITMGIGVDANLNTKRPKDYATTSPLSNSMDYWEDWGTFIFTKLEGSMDKDGDGKFESVFTLHTGTNENYKTVTFTKKIDTQAAPKTALNFDIDVIKVLNGIDLNFVISSDDSPTMKKIIDNFAVALTLK